ncbi:hypothetical protein RJT34_16730 [Clitoria ternatea]|uniref:Uncharacterized protein n=1 Tax=Clitoria ternatea TaxID=43366 RepID=A0AAN9PCK5_CLITE
MDEKFKVFEKTKLVMSAAERSVASAQSAIMRNRYVFTGETWVTNPEKQFSALAITFSPSDEHKTKDPDALYT